MRSVKFLVAMAIVAAFVAGPVMAQDAMSGSTAAPATSSAPKSTAKTHHKKGGKHHKAKSTSTAAPAATPAQ